MWHRNQFVRLMIEKSSTDQALFSNNQRDHWYSVDVNALDPELRATFRISQFDQETDVFLKNSLAISNSFCLQVYYSMMTSLLSLFLTKTSINGLLGRGGMFIFSHNHLRSLLGTPDDWSPNGRMIDIGAGDGAVTESFKTFYAQISAVEVSKVRILFSVMEWRLAQRGFTVIPSDKWLQSGPYNLVSALNLLDRHQDPRQLLIQLHQISLESNCHVLLSIVIPIRQYVEFNTHKKTGNMAKSVISASGTSFEDWVSSFVRNTLSPADFQVLSWTKLPYLCEGDLAQPYYKLDDAVFLLRALPRRVAVPHNEGAKFISIHDEM